MTILCSMLLFAMAVGVATRDPSQLEARRPAGWQLRVRVERGEPDRLRFTRRQMDVVIDEVTRLWRPHGVSILWTRQLANDEPCGDGRGVTVVLTDRLLDQNAATGLTALAWIPFVGGAPTNTIYASIAGAWRWIARARVADRRVGDTPSQAQEYLTARAVGRAIAHELGHYLLASPRHARRGLMRARLSARELLATDLPPFPLGPAERTAIDRRIELLQLLEAIDAGERERLIGR